MVTLLTFSNIWRYFQISFLLLDDRIHSNFMTSWMAKFVIVDIVNTHYLIDADRGFACKKACKNKLGLQWLKK